MRIPPLRTPSRPPLRACNMLKRPPRRLSMVLLTRTAPANVAGLPSLLFHLSDRGGAELSVVGPSGIGEYISAIQVRILPARQRGLIGYKTSMIKDEDPLRGLLFY